MSTDPTKPSAEERAVNIAIELGWNEMTNNSEQRAYDLILAQIRAAEADAREPLEQKLKKQSDFFQERIGELGREVERLVNAHESFCHDLHKAEEKRLEAARAEGYANGHADGTNDAIDADHDAGAKLIADGYRDALLDFAQDLRDHGYDHQANMAEVYARRDRDRGDDDGE